MRPGGSGAHVVHARGVAAWLLGALVAFAIVFSIASVAWAFPETAYPGRPAFGDTCWNANCHGVGNDAGTGPHGNYSSSSNICGICHTLHTASGSKSLLPRDTITQTCLFCHDGTSTGGKGVYGAIAARGLTVTARHSVMTTNVVPGGAANGGNGTMVFTEGGVMGCGDCHSPHGSKCVLPYAGTRARNSPNDTFRNATLTSSRLLRQRPGKVTTAVAEYGSDWCLSCHKGRVSGSAMVVNHPVESLATTTSPYVYDRLPRMASDTAATTVVGGMGRIAIVSGEWRVRHNRAFVMPFPRTPQQAGHGPICQQCHENARGVGAVGAVTPSVVSNVDGTTLSDNPRFQTFPHESTGTALLVEQSDDLCTNCHPANMLP